MSIALYGRTWVWFLVWWIIKYCALRRPISRSPVLDASSDNAWWFRRLCLRLNACAATNAPQRLQAPGWFGLVIGDW
jgi:hypothetical protein